MSQAEHSSKTALRKQAIDFSAMKFDCKDYYPGRLVYELMMPKELLRKNEGLKSLHKLVDASNHAGLLTRQELVSMMPPLLCDIQAGHAVFDMCAAPGSKTAQCLEMLVSSHLYGDKKSNTEAPKGLIVANDADYKRSFLLTHQLNRFNTSNVIVTNHNAQEFPWLYYQPKQSSYPGSSAADKRLLFDRVLCDVPCSSDAAIRKIPAKWSSWSPRESQTLHPLQIKICQRGLEMLKVGGKLSYSTCSLNPIENEAVVAALLQLYPGKIRLVEVDLPGFKFQPGLQTWTFLNQKYRAEVDKLEAAKREDPANQDSYFLEFASLHDVPKDLIKQGTKSNIVRETMFTSHYSEEILAELPKCLRVMPHH